MARTKSSVRNAKLGGRTIGKHTPNLHGGTVRLQALSEPDGRKQIPASEPHEKRNSAHVSPAPRHPEIEDDDCHLPDLTEVSAQCMVSKHKHHAPNSATSAREKHKRNVPDIGTPTDTLHETTIQIPLWRETAFLTVTNPKKLCLRQPVRKTIRSYLKHQPTHFLTCLFRRARQVKQVECLTSLQFLLAREIQQRTRTTYPQNRMWMN